MKPQKNTFQTQSEHRNLPPGGSDGRPRPTGMARDEKASLREIGRYPLAYLTKVNN